MSSERQCPALSPESRQRCVLPDNAAAHYKGHESAFVGVVRAVWADTATDRKRWGAAPDD